MPSLYELSEQFAANLPLILSGPQGLIGFEGGAMLEWAPEDGGTIYTLTTFAPLPDERTRMTIESGCASDAIMYGLGFLLLKHVEKISEDEYEGDQEQKAAWEVCFDTEDDADAEVSG